MGEILFFNIKLLKQNKRKKTKNWTTEHYQEALFDLCQNILRVPKMPESRAQGGGGLHEDVRVCGAQQIWLLPPEELVGPQLVHVLQEL